MTREELLVWEVFGNVKWATGCLTQSRRHLNGQERSVELAVLGGSPPRWSTSCWT